MTTSTMRSLVFDSQLIEDYIHTNDILIDSAAAEPLAIFQNRAGDSEALVISKNAAGHGELYHLYREPLSDSGWNIYGVGAGPLAIAVADSALLWAVGTDGALWQNRLGRWVPATPPLPNGARPMPAPSDDPAGWPCCAPVAVGTDGVVRVVDSDGTLYQLDPAANKGAGAWDQVPGVPADLYTAPVGSGDALWAFTADGSGQSVVRFSAGQWTPVPWSDGATMPMQVSVGTDGSLFCIDNGGALYRFDDGAWQPVGGAPAIASLAVAAADRLWAVVGDGEDQPYQVMAWDGQSWQPVQGPATTTASTGIAPSIAWGSDGTLWYVDATGMSYRSAGGTHWQRQMMPTRMSGMTASGGVGECAAGSDAHAPQAFFTQSGYLWHATMNGAGTWNLNLMLQECSGLALTHQQDNQALILSAVTSDGNLLTLSSAARGGTPAYAPLTTNAHGLLAQSRPLICALSDEAWITAAVIGGQLCAQWGTAQDPLADTADNGRFAGMLYKVSKSTSGVAMPAFKHLIRVPWIETWNGTPGGFYFGGVGADGKVYMVFNVNLAPGPDFLLTGVGWVDCLTDAGSTPLAGVTATSALIDSHGMTRIYATDTQGRLWVLRQNGTMPIDSTGEVAFTWNLWHPLGNGCTVLANGPGATATHELFTLDAEGVVQHLSQDGNLTWHSTRPARPTGTDDAPYPVPMYVTELSLRDANAAPVPGATVTISAAEPVALWCNGRQQWLDVGSPGRFTTDWTGQLRINTLALGLHTAQLSCTADGLAAPCTIYPPQHVHDRLSSVSGGDLQAAQARTQSVPKPVQEPLVASADQPNCNNAATTIQGVYTIQSQHKIQPGATTGAALLGAGAVPALADLRAEWAAKVVSARVIAPAAADPGGFWDDLWQELTRFGEDLWHAIRTGILKLEQIAVDVAQGIVKLTVTLEAGVVGIVHYLIKTIDDVVHAVESAFKWLGAEIEKAIDWLKEFFDWGDILNTKTVIEYWINQAFTHLIDSTKPDTQNTAQGVVQAAFGELVALIEGDPNKPGSDVFSQAKEQFGSHSFNAVAATNPKQPPPSVGSSPLHPDALRATHDAHQVKGNYAQHHAHRYVQSGGKLPFDKLGNTALPGAAGDDPLADFLHTLLAKLDTSNPDSAFSKAQAQVTQGLGGIPDPKNFFDMAISDLVDLAKDLIVAVIDALETLIVQALDIAGSCLAAIQSAVSHEIHIPVISWLWKEISGHPLTLLDLYALILALPATLLYKLIFGGSNASPPFTAAQVDSITSQPICWPVIDGTGIGQSPQCAALAGSGMNGAAAAAAGASGTSIMLGVFSVLNALPYGFFDMGADIEYVNGPGESGYDLSTFTGGALVVLGTTAMVLAIPWQPLKTAPADRSTAQKFDIALWAAGGLPLVLGTLSLILSKRDATKDAMNTAGPIMSAVGGALQLGLGIAASVEFGRPDSGYDAADIVGAVITPLPSIGKLLLLPKQEELLLVLVPLDLVCDLGSGACALVEDIS